MIFSFNLRKREALRAIGLATAASIAAGLSGCVSLLSDPTPQQLAFASIDRGASTRSEVEAQLGAPDYVMASHNVVGYVDEAASGVLPPYLGCDREIYVVQYQDDVAMRAWSGHAFGDLLPWEGGVPVNVDQQGFFKPAQHPLSDAITVGAATRADILAAAGEPYYEMPAHGLAIYFSDAGALKREADCAAGGYSDPDCLNRFIAAGNKAGCALFSGGPGGRLVRLIQYDPFGRVARTDAVLRGRAGFRLDKWAGGAAAADATNTDEMLAEMRRRLEALGPEAGPDACNWLLDQIEGGSGDARNRRRRPGVAAVAACGAAISAAAAAAEGADDAGAAEDF